MEEQINPEQYWKEHDANFEKEVYKDADDERKKANKEHLKDIYNGITKVLRKYCDLREEYYNIIALWIIGSHFHKDFETYPYLFLNAMKGSGKTRLLKLIANLCKNGDVIASISESVLFRSAGKVTLLIDEFEHVGHKDLAFLRELLNAAYKKGVKIKRAKKVKNEEGENYEIESFDVYTPIVMANIWGMENVLEDRCITLTIEKSSNSKITRLLEIFDIDPDIKKLNELFSVVNAISVTNIDVYMGWNSYIYTLTTSSSLPTLTAHTTPSQYKDLFDKIYQTSLDGRHLELFFPIFMIADDCGKLDETIKMAEEISKSKKGEDIHENRDISLIDLISNMHETINFITIKKILDDYKNFIEEEESNDENKWLNTKWIGRSLKRLNLVIDKRRISKGIEVRLNYAKARENMKMFRYNDIETEKVSVLPNQKEVLPIKEEQDGLENA